MAESAPPRLFILVLSGGFSSYYDPQWFADRKTAEDAARYQLAKHEWQTCEALIFEIEPARYTRVRVEAGR
ncbi:MAG: hypothetical protein QME96_12120 [Myxococcota bacterium]|nr:hypothetical protein [Myxococcota bacterium]